tara:strand:+ start:1052 stop:1213 length:162 start_codon:yes stop_codon:yes gene_type:complete
MDEKIKKTTDAYCNQKKKDKFGCMNFVKKTNHVSNNLSKKMQCAARIKQWSKK